MTDRIAAPRISVIIPAYKSARYLAQTLDSVAAQTFTDWECVVVDDGSPEADAEVAQGFAARDPRFRLLRQANAGVAAARNAGYAHAHPEAEYVIFQDSDDVWEPEALAVLVAALDAHPEAAGAHGLAERIGPEGEALPERHVAFMRERTGYDGRRLAPVPPECPTTLDCLVTKFKMFPPGVVLVRRSLVARAGLWTPRHILKYSEDWDFFARVGRFGPIVFVDCVIAGYRKLDDGRSASGGNLKGHFMRRQAILRRLLAGGETTPAQALLVRRAARAWGKSVYARHGLALPTSIRQRQWRLVASHTRQLIFFFLASLASDLDLRVHHLLGHFRRGRADATP